MLQAFRRSTVTWEQTRCFGLLYYPHILHTRRYQAAALATCNEAHLQTPLASLVYDASGGGAPSRSDASIYRQFLLALRVDAQAASQLTPLPAVERYVDTHIALCNADGLTALAVAGLAMKWPIPAMYEKLLTGLTVFPELDGNALELFETHIERDSKHAKRVVLAIAPLIRTADDRNRLSSAIVASLDAQYLMMDELWEAVIAVQHGHVSRSKRVASN